MKRYLFVVGSVVLSVFELVCVQTPRPSFGTCKLDAHYGMPCLTARSIEARKTLRALKAQRDAEVQTGRLKEVHKTTHPPYYTVPGAVAPDLGAFAKMQHWGEDSRSGPVDSVRYEFSEMSEKLERQTKNDAIGALVELAVTKSKSAWRGASLFPAALVAKVRKK